MKHFVIAVALVCALSVSALGGQVPTGGIAPPPPPGDGVTTSSTSPGQVPTGGLTEQSTTNSALTVLLNILSLLAV